MTAADAAFLGLDDGGGRHSMQIEARHCTSHDFLYGGSGVAACAAAAEAVTGRPLVWITTQYIGQARPGERLELDVDVLVAARSTSQTIVRAHVGALRRCACEHLNPSTKCCLADIHRSLTGTGPATTTDRVSPT